MSDVNENQIINNKSRSNLKVLISDVITSHVPSIFCNWDSTEEINMKEIIKSKHHELFRDFIHNLKNVGGKNVTNVINDIINSLSLYFNENENENVNSDTILTNEINELIRTNDYNIFCEHDMTFCADNLSEYLVKTLMINTIKIGIMHDIDVLVSDPIFLETDTWGMRDVNKFTMDTRHIVSNGINQSDNFAVITKNLTQYYSQSLFNSSYLFDDSDLLRNVTIPPTIMSSIQK